MNKIVLRSASMILAIVLAVGIFIPGRATSQLNTLMPNTTINLAYFYKPPSNSNATTVAGNFGLVVLTGGDENFRDQLLSNGFASTVPQYFRSEGIQDPGSCTASPANNQFANKPGDFCNISQNHPDWFLLDTNGNRMRTSPASNYYRMDPGNVGWKNFVLTRLLETQQQKGWSGLFLDNLEASLSEIQRDGLTPAKYPDNTSYQAAVRGFIQYLYTNYSQAYNRPLMANIIARSDDASWYNYIQYLSGAMQERWAVAWSSTSYVSTSKWNSDMALAEQTQSQGKFIILVAPGDKTDVNRQNFAFASYLLIANGKAAFRYSDSSFYGEVWLYDNYNAQLGSPLGARYQSGTTWRRNFTNGYVVVDPTYHTATISVNSVATATSTTAPTLVVTNTSTVAPTSTNTATIAPTLTATDISTAVPTWTNTATLVPTATETTSLVPTLTNTTTPVSTLTATNTSTVPPTLTSTATLVPTMTVTKTSTAVPTFTKTSTPMSVPTKTATPTTTVYNEKNAAFIYSSGWTDVSDSQAYGGAYKLTKVIGSYVTLNFTGQSFTIIYKAGPLLGKMNIYIDGKLVTTLNQYASNPTYQKKWKSGILTAGSHKLKLVFVSPINTGITLDAITIS